MAIFLKEEEKGEKSFSRRRIIIYYECVVLRFLYLFICLFDVEKVSVLFYDEYFSLELFNNQK